MREARKSAQQLPSDGAGTICVYDRVVHKKRRAVKKSNAKYDERGIQLKRSV